MNILRIIMIVGVLAVLVMSVSVADAATLFVRVNEAMRGADIAVNPANWTGWAEGVVTGHYTSYQQLVDAMKWHRLQERNTPDVSQFTKTNSSSGPQSVTRASNEEDILSGSGSTNTVVVGNIKCMNSVRLNSMSEKVVSVEYEAGKYRSIRLTKEQYDAAVGRSVQNNSTIKVCSRDNFNTLSGNVVGIAGLANTVDGGAGGNDSGDSGDSGGSEQASVELLSVSVTPVNPSVVSGETQQFTATGTYTDGSTSDITSQVTWVSSDTDKATISNESGSEGLATCVLSGDTTITASLNAISDTTTLSVTAPPDETPPVPGDDGTIDWTTANGVTYHLYWTAATDDVSSAENLSYYVCDDTNSADGVDTIDECENSADQVMDWTLNTTFYDFVPAPGSHYLNVIVKDEAGNKALYTPF